MSTNQDQIEIEWKKHHDAIRDFLFCFQDVWDKFSGWKTPADLSDLTGLPEGAWQRIFSRLAAQGYLELRDGNRGCLSEWASSALDFSRRGYHVSKPPRQVD